MGGKVQNPNAKPIAQRNKNLRQKPTLEGITRGDIRRMARKGGVVRLEHAVYDNSRRIMKVFLRDILKSALVYAAACKRKTVTGMDVCMAMKKQGCALYGGV